SQGLTLVGLDPTDDDTTVVKFVLQSEALSNPEILIDRHVSDTLFGISLYPTLILLDNNHKVLYTDLGYTKSMEPEIEKAIQTAVNNP
ncbi:MAG TPA: hypothetical protein VFD13_09930, partial [Candidatus Kapabacteria bacterium]|nr:hypothetical protein [Candidatus Kapabacteria bacterium]